MRNRLRTLGNRLYKEILSDGASLDPCDKINNSMKRYSLLSVSLPFFRFMVGVGSILFFPISLQAVTSPPDLIAEQLASASLVADIEIESIQTLSHPTTFAQSIAAARVLKIHRNNLKNQTVSERDIVEIEFMGGEIGNRGAMYSGMPRPYKNHSYRAHLNLSSAAGNSHYVIVGLDEGLVPLNETRNSSRNRTDGSNGQGNGAFLYWDPKYFPITYLISAPTFKNHPEFVSAIEDSFKPWRNSSDVLVEFIAMGCNQSSKNENDSLNSIILVNKEWPFDKNAIAVTRNFYISGEDANAGMILDSDILLNNENFSFTTKGESGKHDIQNILTHEIGHFLGFGHEIAPVDTDATMYASAVAGETKKRDLAANDIAVLESAYQGVGAKFDNQNLHCSISDPTVGCLSVHQPTKVNYSYWGLVGYLIFTLGLGKFIILKQKKS